MYKKTLREIIRDISTLLQNQKPNREFVLDSYKPGNERLYRMEELRKTHMGTAVIRTYPHEGRLISGMMRKYLEGFLDGVKELYAEEQPP